MEEDKNVLRLKEKLWAELLKGDIVRIMMEKTINNNIAKARKVEIKKHLHAVEILLRDHIKQFR